MVDLNCPYCGAENEVNHDDDYGYEEDRLHEMQCSSCEKEFTFTTSTSFSYESYKADCLNNGKHIYKINSTYPRGATKMNCETCEEYRSLTDQEWKDFEKEIGEKITERHN